jgi:hypothetical protein
MASRGGRGGRGECKDSHRGTQATEGITCVICVPRASAVAAEKNHEGRIECVRLPPERLGVLYASPAC